MQFIVPFLWLYVCSIAKRNLVIRNEFRVCNSFSKENVCMEYLSSAHVVIIQAVLLRCGITDVKVENTKTKSKFS